MKMTLTGTCVATFAALALTASAQSPAPQTPPAPAPAPSASVKLDKDIKLTGCVKAGAEVGSFELSNVKKDSAGAIASAAASRDSKNIKLSPAAGVDLAPHIGHTIEVLGAWSAAAAAPAADPKAAKTFTVSELKMVSATCTTGTN